MWTRCPALLAFLCWSLGAASGLADDDPPASPATPSVVDALIEVLRWPVTRLGGRPRDEPAQVAAPPPADLPYAEIIDPAREIPGSLSIGTTSDGRLVNPALLPPDGASHYVVPEHRDRETHYGSEETIALLLGAAGAVHERFPDTRVGIGNISLAGGGDLEWSRSHNTGRDADVAFIFVNASGGAVETDDLVETSRTLVARDDPDLRFDLARNWALVEALLASGHARVQWIFVWEPLRLRLLEYAGSIGADPAVIRAAGEAMRQPSDSARHSDHFHVRTCCTRQDRLEGCVNRGPRRAGADWFEEAVRARVAELLRGAADPDPGVAAACVEFIRRLEPREAAAGIAAALPGLPAKAQLDLVGLLGELGRWGVSGPIAALAESSPDEEVRAEAFRVLGLLADPSSAPALAGIMVRDGPQPADGTPLRLAAAHALRNITSDEILPQLVEAIGDPRPDVRAAVALVLHRTAIHDSPVDPGAPLGPEGPETLAAFWTDWWDSYAEVPRIERLEEAFSEAGYAVGDAGTAPDVPELVRALGDARDFIRFNADRALAAHTGYRTPVEGWSTERRVRFWKARTR